MSLKDFVASIDDFSGWGHPEKIKLFAWHLHTSQHLARVRGADINACYDELQLERPANVGSYLQSFLTRTPRQFLKDAKGYYLEMRVREELDRKYGMRPTTHQVHTLLRDLPTKVPDVGERVFVQEAIACLRANAPRAAIVMTWNLAYDHLVNFILTHHMKAFNEGISRRFANAKPQNRPRPIKTRDDFSDNRLQESVVIEVCRAEGIIGGELYKLLDSHLDIRNSAAHPNLRKFDVVDAEAYVNSTINNAVIPIVV